MRSSFMRWCVILAFVASLGGHFDAMQCVAWIKMIGERASSEGVPKAIVTTLSGKSPCHVCLAIRKARQSGKHDPEELVRKKTPPLYVNSRGIRLVPAPLQVLFRQHDDEPGQLDSAHGGVPTPPPRLS
jgi:hypothetical protein